VISAATDEESLLTVIGKVIGGRYRLERRLGHGGAASVWEAEDLDLERRVAVKLLGHSSDRARFEREARSVASLAHPNVARVFDFGESDDGPYMVLELLPGGTLDDRVRDGRPLPDDDTARIATGIAAGLAHAHALGIVHRDLKPANILFDAEDRPRIADFGIARLSEGGTITEEGTILGTASTLAPEQARGERATPASDVYAFGVILFLMLTGRLPFEADDALTLASLHVTEAAPSIAALRSDAPGRLESLAAAALAKDPEDRPQDGAALVAELAGIAPARLAGAAITETGPAVGRRRLGLAGVAVAPSRSLRRARSSHSRSRTTLRRRRRGRVRGRRPRRRVRPRRRSRRRPSNRRPPPPGRPRPPRPRPRTRRRRRRRRRPRSRSRRP